MKNVTITLDEEVARWIRIRAAERETSVSRLVGDVLRLWMEGEEQYESAREHYQSVKARKLSLSGNYPGREELHDRPGLR